MENKKSFRFMMFIIIIGILIYFQIGNNHPVEAKIMQNSIVSVNILEWSPLIWGIVIIAGSIGITLSYVSWRKYKGEQHSEKKRDKMFDE